MYENKWFIFVRLQMDLPFVVPENHPGRKRRVALLRMTMGSATLTTGPGRMVRRVRKRMKRKEGFFGERAGTNTKSAEVAESAEEAQGRAGPSACASRARRAGGKGRDRWRGIMLEDSTEKLLCQTIT